MDMEPERKQMNALSRRRFLKSAAAATALATAPILLRVARADSPAAALKYGGPTPNSKFYVTSYASTPSVDASAWRLKIHGLVRNPLELDYEQIKALPPIKEELTLECISNPPDGDAISNAIWVGTKLKPLLERAAIDAKATYAVMRAADGYYTGLPVDELTREENFLPYLMNGDPLPPAHGYPLRIFIPGKYGMKQPKWITEIEFIDHEFTGYWEARGWSNSAWRKVNSGFFYPSGSSGLFSIFSGTPKLAAPVDIVGWALAGPSGIKRVEISTDGGGSWHDAELVENRPYVWTVWKYRFAPKAPGDYAIRVRATDGNGLSQPVSDRQTGSGRSGQPRMEIAITSVA
jgi:DMSO/TMAO reductase YedYZ molybdopterin-dependent catalytic subunit